MTYSGRRILSLGAVCGALLLAASCGSKGPQPPQPGSPPFIWAVTQDSYKAGDLIKTNENLERLVRGKSEFAVRAAPLSLVLGAGMARGYMELADKFDTGAKANRNNPAPFRKQVSLFRTQARSIAMQTLESVHQYLTPSKDEKITFAFPFPVGSAAEVAGLKKVTNGLVLQESEIEKLTKETLQRNVILVVSRAAGSPKDPEKAKAVFAQPETQLPRDQFVLAIANSLNEISDLFTSKQLDEPDRLKLICEQTLEVLGSIPASKESKDLIAKVQKQLKKVPTTRR